MRVGGSKVCSEMLSAARVSSRSVCVNGDAARLWTHWLTVTGSAQFSSVQSNMNVLPSIVNRRLTNSTTDRQAQTSRDTTGNLTISIAL